MRDLLVLAAVLMLTASVSFGVDGDMGQGKGTELEPYLIQDMIDFDKFANPNNSTTYWATRVHTKLACNIDLSVKPAYKKAVIAASDVNNSLPTTPFSGIFDGDGHTISNLTIDTEGANNDYLGLFGWIAGPDAELKNLAIVNCNITGGSGSAYLGGLCGYNISGTITNSYATGSVNGGGHLGGLCGRIYYGTIANCYATGAITGVDYLGGLCGSNSFGTTTNCYATGPITGASYLGGLCGGNRSGTVINCYYYLFCGAGDPGAIGLDDLQIIDSLSFAGFDFAGNSQDGDGDNWDITSGYCPKLSWQTDDGLVPVPLDTTLIGSGHSYDPFQINSHADFIEFITNQSLRCGYYILTTDIDLSGDTFLTAVVENFYGHFDGDDHIVNNLTIDTSGADNDYLGLFGRIEGANAKVKNLGIVNCNITGGIDSRFLGGLCGSNSYSTIANCYATGVLNGGYAIGGLCGYSEISGIITNCYATGAVNGVSTVGGLCGKNGGTIDNSYATGAVNGNANLGGLCGYNSSIIGNCYATGAVTGGVDSFYLGGLCGRNDWRSASKITNCYATGAVIGGVDSEYIGGFCGYNPDIITDCFWDLESSGLLISNGGTGVSGFLMQSVGTFVNAGWDFSDGGAAEWWICDGRGYPRLAWQPFGDLDNDSHVNAADFAVLAKQWDLETLVWDISPSNGDGVVDMLDFAVFAGEWAGLAADYDELGDFAGQWLRAGVTAGDIAPEPLGDGVVDILDLQAIAENWLNGPAFSGG